ncbi:MAG: DNA-directed RNA polymerase subunit D [Thermoplasmata archaeon]|jgi:DNA-directed RNA polymerase subunit D|nr:DNA-directed RNA polymerase subunit D [Thermoplasmata archaeon]
MKLKFLELREDYAKILFEDVKPYFVNAIRRTMIADVPKLAIENVIIYDNTSALFDEIIAHRLGMIPLPTHLDILKDCEDCKIHYTLSKEGECTVYSGDLKAEDPIWNVKDKNIPIVRLLKNQRLILEAEAILGTGKEHAKWQSVVGIGYKFYPEIEIDMDKCDLCQDCIRQCPKNILSIKRNKLIVNNIEECSLCKACEEVCTKDAIVVKGNENKIIMQYETDGSLTAKEILKEALEILYKKYDELEKALGL